MKVTDVTTLDLQPHRPQIVSSTDAARVVAVALPGGEQMQTHEVHERAWVVVTSGQIEVRSGEDTQSGGPGLVAEFDPQEPHEVSAVEDARFLLFLAPWPGEGHPGAMSLEDKANARESARTHGQ